MLQKHKTEADLERAQEICCQLVSESQCPPLCQIEAWVSVVHCTIRRGRSLTSPETPLSMLPTQLLVCESPT
jgi:hypothetical protein